MLWLCYHYFDCEQINCPMFGKSITDCWTMDHPTHTHPIITNLLDLRIIPSEKRKCEFCSYRASLEENKGTR